MNFELPFDPFPMISCPHRQTIISAFCHFLFEPASVQKLVRLPCGDVISLEVTTPKNWKATDPTVLLVHGLCGSHKAPNLSRLAGKLEAIGIRAIRMNMRGCGSGQGLAKEMYHSGRSEDVFDCIKALKKEHPNSPLTLIGYSLGGNICLKLAGELSHLASHFLEAVIAVCPPVDLLRSAQLLSTPSNQAYEKYFYQQLKSEVNYRHKQFKSLPSIHLPDEMRLTEFDRLYTAPVYGFKSPADYYEKCSSIYVVPDVTIECKILLSEDDPIVYAHSLDDLHLPSNVSVFKTKKGGHMGFLGSLNDKKGFYWLDSQLLEWITE